MAKLKIFAPSLFFCTVALSYFCLAIFSISFAVAVSWMMGALCWYNYKTDEDIRGVKFLSLHQAPKYTGETAALIHSQWPGPITEEGKSEPNFIRTSSLKESREQFPCHLIAVFQGHVAAHCVIRALPQKRSVSKFARMLKAGVPLGAVKQAAQLAGIDPSYLEHEKDTKQDNVQHGDVQEELEVTVASLVVTPALRGRGLGKAMCAFAARMAGNHGNVKRVCFSCNNELMEFYQKLGCKKMTAVPRPGIPPVRLGNEMFVELDKECLHMADETLNRFS